MIRFSGRSPRGRLILAFGLTEENVKRLQAGKPVHNHCDDMGFAGEVMIFVGKDEATMEAMLRREGIIDQDTIVHDEASKPKN